MQRACLHVNVGVQSGIWTSLCFRM
jgi:hypothetical protein